jgi:hypothetical protein
MRCPLDNAPLPAPPVPTTTYTTATPPSSFQSPPAHQTVPRVSTQPPARMRKQRENGHVIVVDNDNVVLRPYPIPHPVPTDASSAQLPHHHRHNTCSTWHTAAHHHRINRQPYSPPVHPRIHCRRVISRSRTSQTPATSPTTATGFHSATHLTPLRRRPPIFASYLQPQLGFIQIGHSPSLLLPLRHRHPSTLHVTIASSGTTGPPLGQPYASTHSHVVCS